MIEVLLTPSHLAGAKVEHVMVLPGFQPSAYPPDGEKRFLVLDRIHPAGGGRVAIAEEDCTTHFVAAPSVAAEGE